MGVPYSNSYEFADLASGEDHCLQLRVPPRARLNRLIVKQTAGSADGFEFDLYDRKAACPGVSQESCEEGDEAFDPDIHQIMDTVTVSMSNTSSKQFGLVLPYRNRDSLCDGLHASTRPALYLRLNLSGSGPKTVQVAVTTEIELNS